MKLRILNDPTSRLRLLVGVLHKDGFGTVRCQNAAIRRGSNTPFLMSGPQHMVDSRLLEKVDDLELKLLAGFHDAFEQNNDGEAPRDFITLPDNLSYEGRGIDILAPQVHNPPRYKGPWRGFAPDPQPVVDLISKPAKSAEQEAHEAGVEAVKKHRSTKAEKPKVKVKIISKKAPAPKSKQEALKRVTSEELGGPAVQPKTKKEKVSARMKKAGEGFAEARKKARTNKD